MNALKMTSSLTLLASAVACALPAWADEPKTERKFSVRIEGKDNAAIQSSIDSALEKLSSALARADIATKDVNIDVREIRETIRQSLEEANRNGNMILRRSGDDVETGNPYSSREVREFKQTLGDGTVISRQSTRLLARDHDGRTRQELRQADGTARVFINDPVAKQAFIIDPQKKVACKADFVNKGAIHDCFTQMKGDWKPLGFSFNVNKNGIAMMHANDDLVVEVSPHAQIIDLTQRSVSRRGGPDGAVQPVPPVPPVPPLPPLPPTLSSAMSGAHSADNAKVTREKKTKQPYEGLMVDTDRTVETIAAGAIGNNKAIENIYERYYSPELKMNVYVRRSDPRNGESLYRMTDVKRTDPDATLFKVPAGYSVIEGKK